MKIRDSYVQDMKISIRLEESERFKVTYTTYGSSREDGAQLLIHSLIASVDILDGTASVEGFGYLVNKNGEVGERDRRLYLELDDILFEVRDVVIEEVRQARERIAAVQGVVFQ